MTTFLYEILGTLTGIYCVAAFLNSLFKKRTKSDSDRQKYLATLISTILYIAIPSWMSKIVNEDIYEIWGWVIISVILGIIVGIFFMRRFKLKTYLLILFYGLVLWFTIGILIFLLLSQLNLWKNYMGAVEFLIVFGVSAVLVLKQKLPWTKNNVK